MKTSTEVTTAITEMNGRAARISQFGGQDGGFQKIFGWNLKVADKLNALVTRINDTFEKKLNNYELVNRAEPLLKDLADKENDLKKILNKIDAEYDVRMVLFNQALVDLPPAIESLKKAINAIDLLDGMDDDQLIISDVKIDDLKADFS